MEKVLIDSVRQPGRTKLVAPVFADILIKLNLYRRVDVKAQPTAGKPARNGEYRRRDMVAETKPTTVRAQQTPIPDDFSADE